MLIKSWGRILGLAVAATYKFTPLSINAIEVLSFCGRRARGQRGNIVYIHIYILTKFSNELGDYAVSGHGPSHLESQPVLQNFAIQFRLKSNDKPFTIVRNRNGSISSYQRDDRSFVPYFHVSRKRISKNRRIRRIRAKKSRGKIRNSFDCQESNTFIRINFG